MPDVKTWTLDDLIPDRPGELPAAPPDRPRRARHAAVEPAVPAVVAARPAVGVHAKPTGRQAKVPAAHTKVPAAHTKVAAAHAAPSSGAHAAPTSRPDRRAVLAIGATAAVAAACTGSSHVRHAAGGLLQSIAGGSDTPASGLPSAPAELPLPIAATTVPPPTTSVPGGGTLNQGIGAIAGGGFVDRNASYAGSAAPPPAVKPGKPAPAPQGGVRGSASVAAKAITSPSARTPLALDSVEHLLSRFTFGATPTARAEVHHLGIDGWVNHQLAPATGYAGVGLVRTSFPLLPQSGPQVRATLKAAGNEFGWDAMDQLSRATVALQTWSPWQLYERMVDFWENHLAVANHSDGVEVTRHVYDRDVIRAHALGRFSDLLLASAKSPAMLHFLNQDQSDKGAPNENYARELMELHTLGVGGGYTEADVQSVAKLLTGRTIDKDVYVFNPDRHYVGPIRALKFSHPNSTARGGEAAGDAFLAYLAQHPSTANMIARKLAVRFVSDTPPAALVARLASVYLANHTAIVPMLKTLFASTEFWASRGQKTRRPAENVVAALRTLGVQPGKDVAKGLGDVVYSLSRMNNAPMDWKPPNGYPDVAAAWRSSGAMLDLWRTHRDMAGGYYGNSAFTFAALPGLWAGRPPATMGAAVDALSMRLVGQRLPAAQRGALVRFLGAADTTPARTPDLGGQLGDLVPLLLDSIFHALR